MVDNTKKMPNGAAAAAFLGSGIGCLVIGLMTSLVEASAGVKTALTWSKAVGPLSGKTGIGVLAWLVAWVVLHFMWKDKETDFQRIYIATLVLIALGLLLTFPPIFKVFAGG
jgi:hypothetical protein